jgi:hypothetical protein
MDADGTPKNIIFWTIFVFAANKFLMYFLTEWNKFVNHFSTKDPSVVQTVRKGWRRLASVPDEKLRQRPAAPRAAEGFQLEGTAGESDAGAKPGKRDAGGKHRQPGATPVTGHQPGRVSAEWTSSPATDGIPAEPQPGGAVPHGAGADAAGNESPLAAAAGAQHGAQHDAGAANARRHATATAAPATAAAQPGEHPHCPASATTGRGHAAAGNQSPVPAARTTNGWSVYYFVFILTFIFSCPPIKVTSVEF